jgi:ATP-dependent Clp protease ATP-binding subunit ClpC
VQEESEPQPPVAEQAENQPQPASALSEQLAGTTTPQPELAQQPDRFHHWTAQARATLNVAVKEARRLGHGDIGDEHLLLGLLRVGNGAASKLLLEAGASVGRMREAVSDLTEDAAGGDGVNIPLADRGREQ